MEILFLEPYYGGSHKAFIEGWKQHTEHNITVFELPPYKWRWRMRHSAVTFAERIADAFENGETFDAIVCSGMLDLATFIGLAPLKAKAIPSILYMHENQLTYPVPDGVKRDSDAVFKQITSCLAATEIWWNSAYNLNSFLDALPKYLKRMPDFKMLNSIELIREKSKVMHLGISNGISNIEQGISNSEVTQQNQAASSIPQTNKTNQPIITWAARWEHDKNPEDFFQALAILKSKGLKFKLNVIGEQFRTYPDIFDSAEKEFSSEIINWGYAETREDYIDILRSSDIIVSTAIHEFFGISILEGVMAGAFPVLPNRLAYPELFDDEDFFYGETALDLEKKLTELINRKNTTGSIWLNDSKSAQKIAQSFRWEEIAKKLDKNVELWSNEALDDEEED